MLGSDENAAYSTIASYNPSYIEKVDTGEAPSKTKEDSYIILGPFQINKVNGGEISTIELTDGNNTLEAGNNGGIEYTTEYGLPSNDWRGNISEINWCDAQTKVYLRIQDTYGTYSGNNWKVKFKSNSIDVEKGAVYKGRIVCSSSLGDSQNKLIYNAITEPSVVEYDLTVVEPPKDNTLRVVKYGVSENGNINNATKQAGVGFIINKEGVGYLKYNNQNQIVRIGKMEYNETNFSWTSDRNSATIFETVNTVENGSNWDGYFQITKMPAGKYYIGEVYNHNTGYEDSLITTYKLEYEGEPAKEGFSSTDVSQNTNISGYTEHNLQVITLELAEDGYTKALRIYDTVLSDFNIILNKVNSSNTKVGGAEFKIKVYNGNQELGWLYCEDPNAENIEYKYNNSYSESTTWNTAKGTNSGYKIYAKEEGILQILKLNPNYKYKIYEFKPATNYYNLLAQTINGMTVTINGTTTTMSRESNYVSNTDYIPASIYCGEVSYQQHGASANVKVVNIKGSRREEFVDISGKVWLDGAGNKSGEGNGKYGDKIDQYLSGVKVYLKKVDTNKIIKYNGKDYIVTDSGGYYNFDGSIIGIKSSNLSKYYIEVDYSNCPELNKEQKYGIVEFGTGKKQSKATYLGNGYASTDAINSSYNEYMNVGLKLMPTETQSVEKWVDRVEVIMKENKYTYKYGENNTGVGGVTSVGIGNSSYYRTIYASDIIYSKQDDVTDGLEVYITYKIKVSNDTTTYQSNGESHIREKYMIVDIYDKYDENYYELADKNWKRDGKGSAKCRRTLYNKNNPDYKNNKNYTDTDTVEITFKLTDGKKVSTKDAINKILSDGSFTASNKATIEGYHYYDECKKYIIPIKNSLGKIIDYRVEYKWKEKDTDAFGYAYAPGMTFSIYEQDGKTVAQRTISGTVFEDLKNEEKYEETGAIRGDGRYGSDEGYINKVKVELMNASNEKITGENQTSATRYIYSDEEDENDNIVRTGEATTASIYTSKGGTYTFEGIIPGDYYIRFTYGDGNQTIIKVSPSGSKDVCAYDYKSTTIENTSLADMIKIDREKQGYSNYYWYRNTSILSGYSTAVDILNDREEFNKNSGKKADIRAYTPTFKITLENESVTSKNSDEVGNYKIQNMNFGIIETPKIQLGFDKVITNIKVTNTSGQIIVDGNPATKEIRYLSNLDKDTIVHITKGSNNVKIEINDEKIYGAELEITYAITVLNNSDLNYYENSTSSYYGYYYMFGDSSYSTEVSITPGNVADELSENLTLIWEDGRTDSSLENDDIIINKWNPLYTQRKNRLENSNEKTQDVAILKAKHILSDSKTDSMEYTNNAKILKIEVTNKPNLIERMTFKREDYMYNNYFTYKVTKENISKTFENPADENYLTITPPTGSDKITPIIYIITTVISGIIITIGIIVIKKKVLNK